MLTELARGESLHQAQLIQLCNCGISKWYDLLLPARGSAQLLIAKPFLAVA